MQVWIGAGGPRLEHVASASGIRHSRSVRRRASKVILAAGFVLVLVLLICLFALTRTATQAATSPRPVESVQAAAEPAAQPVERSAVRSATIAARPPVVAAPRAHPVATSPSLPEAPPAPAVEPPEELKRDANGKLVPIMFVADLRSQVQVTEASMKACVEKLGQRSTGKATLNFTVAARNNKLVIDTTGVEDEDTLADNPALVDCMQKTSNAFVVDKFPIPPLGTPIYVRRHVRVENGALVENSVFDFSYRR
jgi:hypothetical protein